MERFAILHQVVEPTLQRELHHRGVLTDEGSLSADLLGWIEICAG
jgi:hypothetical protein